MFDMWLRKIARGKVRDTNNLSAEGKASLPNQVTTEADIWQGPTERQPVPPSSGIQLTATSTSAEDVPGGTGVRRIAMIYLDTNLDQHVHEQDLNGTTGVALDPTNVAFVQCIYGVESGSNGAAAGDISFTNGGTTYKFMPAGNGRCRSSMRMVPAGKRLMVAGFVYGVTSQSVATIHPASTSLDGKLLDGTWVGYRDVALEDSSIWVPNIPPMPFPAGALLTMRVNSSKDATATGSWFGWLEKESQR